MGNLSSYFEFFAAINCAYIISNQFLEALIMRFNGSFTTIERQLNLLLNFHNKNSKDIQAGYKLDTAKEDEKFKNYLEELSRDASDITDRLNDFETQLNLKKRENTISFFFNYMCLFGALYCILILALIGLDFPFRNTIDSTTNAITNGNGGLTFFVINMLCVLFLMIFVIYRIFISKTVKDSDKLIKVPNYNGAIICFTSLSIPLILGYIANEKIDEKCQTDFSSFNVGFAMILPTFHYGYYFVKSKFASLPDARNLEDDFDTLQLDCHAMVGQMKLLNEENSELSRSENLSNSFNDDSTNINQQQIVKPNQNDTRSDNSIKGQAPNHPSQRPRRKNRK